MAGNHYGASFFTNYGGRFNQYWWARRFYAGLIRRYRKSGKVLEIGCGLGHVLQRLQDDFETYGIDVSEHAINEAKKNTPKSHLQVALAEDIETLPGPFDVIAGFHVVEHLEDPLAVLKTCARATTPGGLIILATPNTEAPFAKSKGERWYANRDPSHIALKSPKEWTALLNEAGYRVRRAFGDGMWDVPYVPLLPAKLQLLIFGWPAMLQTATTVPMIPVRFGEAFLVVAERV